MKTAPLDEGWQGTYSRRTPLDPRVLGVLATLGALSLLGLVFAGFYEIGRASGRATSVRAEPQPSFTLITTDAPIPASLSSAPPIAIAQLASPRAAPSTHSPVRSGASSPARPPVAVAAPAPVRRPKPAPVPVRSPATPAPLPVRSPATPAPRPGAHRGKGNGGSSGGESGGAPPSAAGGGSFDSSG
jgi:hypothetical protein